MGILWYLGIDIDLIAKLALASLGIDTRMAMGYSARPSQFL